MIAGGLGLLAIGLFAWWMQPRPVPYEPPPPPTRAVPAPASATPREVQRRRPPPVPVPASAAEEGLEAVADAIDGTRVRCDVPVDLRSKVLPLKFQHWEGSTVTMVVAAPSGRLPVRDIHRAAGRQTAGHLVWEDVPAGTVGDCRFEPAEDVTVDVEVVGADPAHDLVLWVCSEDEKVPIVAGRASFTLPADEYCTLQLRWFDDADEVERLLQTRMGTLIPIRPASDLQLALEVVDRDALSDEERQAISDEAASRAGRFLGETASPDVDPRTLVDLPGLSPEARAWLSRIRR